MNKSLGYGLGGILMDQMGTRLDKQRGQTILAQNFSAI